MKERWDQLLKAIILTDRRFPVRTMIGTAVEKPGLILDQCLRTKWRNAANGSDIRAFWRQICVFGQKKKRRRKA